MLKIDLSIPERTVELENSRSPETMDKDDLLWCFSVQIHFVNPLGEITLLTLSEASLFDFLNELSKLRKAILEGANLNPVTIEDKEGTFLLILKEDNGVINIEDENQEKSFRTSTRQFVSATEEFIVKAIDSAELRFPTLKNNPNYRELISSIKSNVQ